MKDDRSDERKYCSHCKKLVEVEGGLDRQGIYNKCMECGATIDSKTKDGNLDDMIKKMAREKADVPYNDDGTIRTPQQAQLAYERWYKIIKSRYKNDSRYAAEYADSKVRECPNCKNQLTYAGEENGKTKYECGLCGKK